MPPAKKDEALQKYRFYGSHVYKLYVPECHGRTAPNNGQFSARLSYFQCVTNGDTTALCQATHIHIRPRIRYDAGGSLSTWLYVEELTIVKATGRPPPGDYLNLRQKRGMNKELINVKNMEVIPPPCSNFNGGLVKSPLNLGLDGQLHKLQTITVGLLFVTMYGGVHNFVRLPRQIFRSRT